ncbi:MAG: AAA family ATPase [Deltaproteobacteria bacterium]|nr:MAG: AAA family ATPase [Deltaproteobacteria bacterium]
MYESYYGFNCPPFSKTPDPKFLYRSKEHAEALERLKYAVEERELTVLTGDIGTGKTTLSRALIDSLDDSYKVALIINPRLTPAQLLRVIARRLGVESPSYWKNELLDQINQFLYQLYEQGGTAVIIFDEAQLIPSKGTFEEIRLLSNFQLDDKNLLSLILIGQTGLRKRLRHRTYTALRQRIGIQFHLGPLSIKEAKEYINFRLKVAGRDGALFSEGALEMIYKYSQGLPRSINNIASNALLEGYGLEAEQIDERIIDDVVRELELALQ